MYFESFSIRCDPNRLDILVFIVARKQFVVHKKINKNKKKVKKN